MIVIFVCRNCGKQFEFKPEYSETISGFVVARCTHCGTENKEQIDFKD